MTVAEMLTRVSAKEYTSWRLLEGIEPWGERREDFRAAVCTGLQLKAWGSKLDISDVLDALIDPFDKPSPVREEAAREARNTAAALAWTAYINRQNAHKS